MNRRYGLLLVVVAVVGILLGILARRPHSDGPAPPPPPPPARVAVALTIDASGVVSPERDSIPKGATVSLAVANRGTKPRLLALAGYEEHVHVAVPPGESRTVEFLADHPGSDFAWLVDGTPAGRLAVTGSHLEEGHE